ncbi:uncharacterized protein J4E87_009869 [Alternaria ethzedia]|uniref:uncharacterized protein n=1 Tax=Alternaria ethzedia TaxID=181014 RepID=UPI0020C4E8B9|nr:uncharacterized protein J4E87_009869 [Alternaria ethzedia]KAI4613402.1 hypothetical protein J4E87_009869 [Alternaria ethzedia]
MSSASMGKGMATAQEQAECESDRLDKITELNATQSPLLRLPTEIRNQIYTYIFSDTIYNLDRMKWLDDETVTFSIYRAPPFSDYVGSVVLPFACRQLHHETSLLPYQLATFDFGKAHVIHNDIFPEHAAMTAFIKARTKAQVENLGKIQIDVEWRRLSPRIRTGNGAYWAAELGRRKFFSYLSEDELVKFWGS